MFAAIKSLYKKEILDILRDKKTIVVMVLIPLLLYPLLFLGSMYVATLFMTNQQTTAYKIAFDQVTEQKAIEQVMKSEKKKNEYEFEIISLDKGMTAKEAMEQEIVDAVISQSEKDGQIAYKIAYLSGRNASSNAADHMTTVFEDYRELLREQAVEKAGLDKKLVLYPIVSEKVDQSPDETVVGNLLGMLLPFLMIISILMGAVYPAIDSTAGEKERGTLETLLTLPVTNFQLIMSKFFAVSTVSIVSALLNFVSVSVMGIFMYQSMDVMGTGKLQVNWLSFAPALCLMLVCVIVFAMLISALSLCICIFAKSFKEAQNYTSPLLLVVMMIGYVGFIPDIKLDHTFAMIPIVNITLLVKGIFTFEYSISNLCIVLATNLAYSFLVIMLMSKIYDSESLLFGEGGSVKIFERRSQQEKGQMPGIGDAILLMAVALLVLFYVGGLATAKLGFGGVAVEQGIFLLLSLGFAWYIKTDFKKLFSLRLPKLRHVFGGVFLWMGTCLATILLNCFLIQILPGNSAEELIDQNAYFAGQPAWALILVVAILPPICEEMLFRGFLFGTMKSKWRLGSAIVVSGVIFGLYHMNLIKAISISVLGIALAYGVSCSESIFVSIIMHMCQNGISVAMMLKEEQMQKVLPFLFEDELDFRVVLIMSAIAVVCIFLGWLLLRKKKA